MKPSDLTDRFPEGTLARQVLRHSFRGYQRTVWGSFDGAFRFYEAVAGPRPAPHKARSVLHVSNLSHKPYMLSRAMRAHGVKSDYLAINAETGWLKVGERGYDANVPALMPAWLFRPLIEVQKLVAMLSRYDVIHYHFASLLTPDGRELDYLRRMGKCIVFHFRGCDLRQGSVNRRLNPTLNCCAECDYPVGSCETEVQYRRIELARKYADLLFVTTPDLLDFLPNAEHIPFIAPPLDDLEAVVPAPRQPGIFRVVTSSNHPGVDGTPYVRAAVERLQQEGHNLELIDVQKTPYEETLALYKSADLYAGKLRMGYYNNANIECLAMGVPCMSYIRPAFLEAITDCPIIDTQPDTMYERLRYFLDHREELRAIGSRGPAFVAQHHAPGRVVQLLFERYDRVLAGRAARTTPIPGAGEDG